MCTYPPPPNFFMVGRKQGTKTSMLKITKGKGIPMVSGMVWYKYHMFPPPLFRASRVQCSLCLLILFSMTYGGQSRSLVVC